MKYEYVHKKFSDLDQAVSYAHSLNWRIVGFSFHHYTDRGEWSVIFEKKTKEEKVIPHGDEPRTGYARVATNLGKY